VLLLGVVVWIHGSEYLAQAVVMAFHHFRGVSIQIVVVARHFFEFIEAELGFFDERRDLMFGEE
jgi:hypothetical protein